MPVNDVQITRDGPVAVPMNYTLPATQEIQVRAVNVDFDGSAAGGDWIPALVIVGQSGRVIARAADPANVVTAGDDAEVSWFPGVKNSSSATVQLKSRVIELWSVANNPLVSGVAKALTFSLFNGNSTAFAPLGYGTGPYAPTTVQDFRVHVDYTVNFPAGNYDRYIDIAQATGQPPENLFTDRIRDSVTPNGDSLTLSAVVVGSPNVPQPISFTAFQASGANQNVTAFIRAYGWPEIAGDPGWPG